MCKLVVRKTCTRSGMGQTEVEFMDLEDQAILRDEILNLLGLTHVPDKKVHRVDLRDLGNHTVITEK